MLRATPEKGLTELTENAAPAHKAGLVSWNWGERRGQTVPVVGKEVRRFRFWEQRSDGFWFCANVFPLHMEFESMMTNIFWFTFSSVERGWNPKRLDLLKKSVPFLVQWGRVTRIVPSLKEAVWSVLFWAWKSPNNTHSWAWKLGCWHLWPDSTVDSGLHINSVPSPTSCKHIGCWHL